MFAKLYQVTKPRPLWQVVFRDPSALTKGRAKRVRKHFPDRETAEHYQRELNETILREGTEGVTFGAAFRADAIAARQTLDIAGHFDLTLQALAADYTGRVRHGGATAAAIAPALEEFLMEKETIEGAAWATVTTLKNRLQRWIDAEGITTLGELTRERMEALRVRPGVSAQSRRNDMAAVSAWCTWLMDKGRISHHPLKGLRRPKLPPANRATFTTEDTEKILRAAQRYLGGRWLATLAVMIYVGPRPSELAELRLLYPKLARIEGGKLRGRANRTVPLLPAALAWLTAAGKPERVAPINTRSRRNICAQAGVAWVPDICRHTFISNRMALVKNDAQVAREAGTSEAMIHRHYHSLKMPGEARKWAALRP